MKRYNLAVVGAGAVGIEMLRCLRERKFPLGKLRVFARSARKINVDQETYQVEAISEDGFEDVKIALFAGTEGEKGAAVHYAAEAIKRGAVVIDNGNDFRLKGGVPLIVPEINKEKLSAHQGLIASPNCTTIQAVVALGGIYKNFGLDKFTLVSFQATSGAGRKAADSLWEETKEIAEKNKDCDYSHLNKRANRAPQEFTHQIAFNLIPQIGIIQDDGYTSEEWKVVRETHKIFGDDSIKITATCVRVPVFTSHSEAIYFTPRKKTNLKELEETLAASGGVKYLPDSYPLPLDAEGSSEVFVGRLRKDPFAQSSFWLWCVADNLRKGAALNAVQIAEHLLAYL